VFTVEVAFFFRLNSSNQIRHTSEIRVSAVISPLLGPRPILQILDKRPLSLSAPTPDIAPRAE
jgi:hypothetical protein